MKFKNISLRMKIFLVGLIPLIFLLANGFIAITSIRSINQSDEWVVHTHDVLEQAMNITSSAVDMETGMRGYLLAGKEDFLDPYKNGEKQAYEKIDALKKTVSDNPRQVERLDTIQKTLKEWQSNVTEPMIALRREVGNTKTMDDLAALVGEAKGKKYFDKFRRVIREFDEEERSLMEKRQADKISTTNTAQRITILFTVIAIVIAVILSVIITRAITLPIAKGVEMANRMAAGDLTRQIDMDQKDEVGALASALNKMSKNLQNMFSDIASGTQTLTASSTELATISEQISSNSEQTAERSNNVSASSEEMAANMNSVAASTEQTAVNIQTVVSAIEEMSSTINEIANNTAKGSDTTTKAVETAKHVSLKVDELGNSASEINKVTETISDISEQTNLLALNATIEAARAGEAGKGFAVVAGEIKALAQQTAEATSEISTRISGVQSNTKEAVESIEAIVAIINEINEIVANVAAAIEEQSVTTQEISNNVAQASQGVQEVNDNVNQASAVVGEVNKDISQVNLAANEMNSGSQQVNTSADELSKLAESLNEMVNRFKI